MPPVPPMVQPSSSSTVAFLLIVGAIAAMVVLGTQAAGRGLGEAPAVTRRWVRGTAVGVVVWLALTGLASASGVLEAPGVPPRVMVFLGGCNLLAVAFALSKAGGRLVRGLPIAALVGFQGFRLPLELVLHRWYEEGVLPVQMTYVGRNLDIVTGIVAIVVGLVLWRRGPSRGLLWAFNLLGLGLLINVITIAVLSSPVPFRVFTNDPAVVIAFHFPYGWIAPICVAGALAGHVLVFRWLWNTRRG